VLIHGGAGNVPMASRERHVAVGKQAALAGYTALLAGASAVAAAEVTMLTLENDGAFNAGSGACLNEDGVPELDAAIMLGTRLEAGAVSNLTGFANPISVARAVLEDGRCVMLAGEGAARFALAHGFARVPTESLVTELARARYLEHKSQGHDASGWAGGTVGVVIAVNGVVVAATSTGGKIGKLAGRVGDSPIIGAGTYADDLLGACSTTGDGERFLRACVARVAVDGTRDQSPEAAARFALTQMVERVGGEGGLIVVDRAGRYGFARNTATMTWAAMTDELAAPAGGM
jgi:L-asparaginase / beta-aspartyl-peptidase